MTTKIIVCLGVWIAAATTPFVFRAMDDVSGEGWSNIFYQQIQLNIRHATGTLAACAALITYMNLFQDNHKYAITVIIYLAVLLAALDAIVRRCCYILTIIIWLLIATGCLCYRVVFGDWAMNSTEAWITCGLYSINGIISSQMAAKNVTASVGINIVAYASLATAIVVLSLYFSTSNYFFFFNPFISFGLLIFAGLLMAVENVSIIRQNIAAVGTEAPPNG